MTNQIQWFPGHMAKTKRMIKECLSEVDVILELLDARIPYSSKNPEIDTLIGTKPKLTILTKAMLADPEVSRAWVEKYNTSGQKTVIIDSLHGQGIDSLSAAIREILAEKIERYRSKGMEGRKLRAMIVGIPNVGKSSLINKLAANNKAKVENRPGVTLTKQWISTSLGIDLLDMPGILWPKFEDQIVGQNLAVTGAIRDEIMDVEIPYYLTKQDIYGLPLDNRSTYSKSDWIIWTATMADSPEHFEAFIDPLWKFYNETVERVPMSDWFYTDKPEYCMFIARSVVGGYFIKMLPEIDYQD